MSAKQYVRALLRKLHHVFLTSKESKISPPITSCWQHGWLWAHFGIRYRKVCTIIAAYKVLLMCFHSYRCETFNSLIRARNIFGNKQAPSRDIAHGFAVIEHLRFVCSGGSLTMDGNQRLDSYTYNKIIMVVLKLILGQEKILIFISQRRSKSFSIAYLLRNYSLNVVYFSKALWERWFIIIIIVTPLIFANLWGGRREGIVWQM